MKVWTRKNWPPSSSEHGPGRPWRAPLLAALALLAVVPPALANSPAFSSRVENILEDRAFQTELPFEPSGRWGSDTDDSRNSGRTVRAPRELSLAGLGGPLMQALAWMILGVLLVLLVFAFGVAWWRRQGRDFELAEETATGRPSAPEGNAGADPDLDALVRAGRWAEAVHLLLRLAVRRLEQRLRRPVPANLTSREMLRMRDVKDHLRAPLATLVEAAELSRFGGLPTTREDYERCADAYEAMRAG